LAVAHQMKMPIFVLVTNLQLQYLVFYFMQMLEIWTQEQSIYTE
jgi:hypothetical protein